jgi:hypothetical protein
VKALKGLQAEVSAKLEATAKVINAISTLPFPGGPFKGDPALLGKGAIAPASLDIINSEAAILLKHAAKAQSPEARAYLQSQAELAQLREERNAK